MAIGKFKGGGKSAPAKASKAPAKSKFSRKSREDDEDDADDEEEQDEDDADDEDEDERPAKKGSKKAPAKKAGKSSKPSKKGGSRWGNMSWGNQRDPMLDPGDYVLKVLECTCDPPPFRGALEWFKGKVEVVDAGKKSETAEGSVCTILINSESDAGAGEIARFIGTAAGAESEDDFRERFDDEEGTLITSVINCGEESPIFGRFLRCKVSLGKPVVKDGAETGDHYRVYQFSTVDEDQQDVDAPEGNG